MKQGTYSVRVFNGHGLVTLNEIRTGRDGFKKPYPMKFDLLESAKEHAKKALADHSGYRYAKIYEGRDFIELIERQ